MLDWIEGLDLRGTFGEKGGDGKFSQGKGFTQHAGLDKASCIDWASNAPLQTRQQQIGAGEMVGKDKVRILHELS